MNGYHEFPTEQNEHVARQTNSLWIAKELGLEADREIAAALSNELPPERNFSAAAFANSSEPRNRPRSALNPAHSV